MRSRTIERIILASVIVMAGLGLSACVEIPKYPTFEPVSPRPSSVSARGAVGVDSLTPTFSWKAGGAAGGFSDTYDFAIWEVLSEGSVGEVVEHKEAIFGTSYTLAKPLQADRDYYWSVRKSGSSVWATISFVGVSPIGANWGHGQPFKIHTPKATKP